MFIGLKHPRSLSVIFVILNAVPLEIAAHYSKDGVLRIIKDPMIEDRRNKSTYIHRILDACKGYDIEAYVWGLDAAYQIIDKALNSIYDDEELIEVVSTICEKYETPESVDFKQIDIAVKDILNKRDWLDENDRITPYLIHRANQKHSIFSKLETCKDIKDWMQTKEFKDLVATE